MSGADASHPHLGLPQCLLQREDGQRKAQHTIQLTELRVTLLLQGHQQSAVKASKRNGKRAGGLRKRAAAIATVHMLRT